MKRYGVYDYYKHINRYHEYDFDPININTFIEMLQGIVQKLNNAQDALSQIGENLGTNSQQSASATAQIMANIDSVRKQTESQSNAVNDTSVVLVRSAELFETFTCHDKASQNFRGGDGSRIFFHSDGRV